MQIQVNTDNTIEGRDELAGPARLQVADVAANNLYPRIVVRPDRTLDLAEVLRKSKPEKSEGKPAQPPPMPVKVDVIRLENSRADFTDQSIQPHFSIGIQNLHGTLRGLNSKPGQSAEPRLEGQVDPGAVTGTRLRVLAQERTAAIRDYLIGSEGLKPERIFLGDVRVERGDGPRVRSELGLGSS